MAGFSEVIAEVTPRLASRLLVVGSILFLSGGFVLAQESGEDPPAGQEEAEGGYKLEEVIVVTASRSEQRLQEVPAAMTVISAEELETLPADDYGDVLRNVPGLNVSQISARDIQISTRGATSSLSTDQLVLLDGRTVYLDFFGFVMWDLLPVDFREIKQVEVLRGPASAVWGANAIGGVINLITKSPREMQGTSVQVGGGELGSLYGSLTHARATDNLGFKISASYYEQDPYDRPTGIIDNPARTPYPPFANQGTEQPKVDLRLDYDSSDEVSWTFGAGYAGTDGIVHSGIGPFDINSGSNLSYFKAGWMRRAMSISAFANILDGDAINLLTVGVDGRPLTFAFESQTYNLDFNDTRIAGQNHILTYGANVRKVDFDLSIAPLGDNRDETGAFFQDEILFGDKWRWLIGARWDDIDPIDSVVSPRTSLAYSPRPNHTFRVSYNEAFRAPSLVENFLGTNIVNVACLLPGVPADPRVCGTPLGSALLIFPTATLGNPLLQEEQLTAYEAGYVGSFARNRGTVTLSVYRNELEDATDFFPATFYSTANPPPGWPPPGIVPPGVPPQFIPVPPGTFPTSFTYRNIGEIVNEGFEFSLDYRPSLAWHYNFNYSYQADPEVTGIDPAETNQPPTNRFNAGVAYSGERYFAHLNGNYVDEAVWTDVLDARFHGPTDSYVVVNLSLGLRLAGDKVTLSVIGNNIFDEDAQQHVFGDIISRKVTGQVSFRF